MAIERTPEQTVELLAKLSAPFHPSEVKWRVISKSDDKQRGLVAPYADPRAYHNRLNDVLTPGGWSCKYTMNTLNGITRVRKYGEAPIATGKITAIASLEIFGVSEKSSMGEMWADDENAVTRAEAQAFKRVCSMFGLGRYLYEVKSDLESSGTLWVPLDARGFPKTAPQLPTWALPENLRPKQKQQTQPSAPAQPPVQISGRTVAPAQSGMNNPQPSLQTVAQPSTEKQIQSPSAAKQRFDKERKKFEAVLGLPLFLNILVLTDKYEAAGKLTEDKDAFLCRKMEECCQTLEQVRRAAGDLPTGTLEMVLESYGVSRLDLIPSHKVLHLLGVRLGVFNQPQHQKAA